MAVSDPGPDNDLRFRTAAAGQNQTGSCILSRFTHTKGGSPDLFMKTFLAFAEVHRISLITQNRLDNNVKHADYYSVSPPDHHL